MDVADILDGAADLIKPEGRWVQGEFVVNDKGTRAAEFGPWPRGKLCYCMLGAISRASDDRLVGESGFGRVVRHLGFTTASDVADWNDAPERTQAEVVAKLREAAARARATGQ